MSLRQGVSRNPADQMEAHGYDRKTFRFETDVEGEPVVHRVDGQHPDTHYNNTSRTVLDEIGQVFDVGKNIYFIVNSTGLFGGGVGGGRGEVMVLRWLLTDLAGKWSLMNLDMPLGCGTISGMVRTSCRMDRVGLLVFLTFCYSLISLGSVGVTEDMNRGLIWMGMV